jgi:hypothetical protein
MKKAFAYAVAIAGIGLMAGSVSVFGVRAPGHQAAVSPSFGEEKWPFLLDQWGVGRAFLCTPEHCGTKVEVFIRPKIGFCNCATGVADEQELERVADTDLVTADAKPLGAAHPIKVGWMKGMSRQYRAGGKSGENLISLAFNDECDVVVALAMLGADDPANIEPEVMTFLRSDPIVLWAKKELGLEFVKRVW